MTLSYIKKIRVFLGNCIEPNILNQWHMGGKERADVMRTSRYCWVVGTKALAQSVKGTQSSICRATSVCDRWLHSPSSTHRLHVYKIKSMFFRVFLPFFFLVAECELQLQPSAFLCHVRRHYLIPWLTSKVDSCCSPLSWGDSSDSIFFSLLTCCHRCTTRGKSSGVVMTPSQQ